MRWRRLTEAVLPTNPEVHIPGIEVGGTATIVDQSPGGLTVEFEGSHVHWRYGDAWAIDQAPDCCWRCDAAEGETDVGLCASCHADLTTP